MGTQKKKEDTRSYNYRTLSTKAHMHRKVGPVTVPRRVWALPLKEAYARGSPQPLLTRFSITKRRGTKKHQATRKIFEKTTNSLLQTRPAHEIPSYALLLRSFMKSNTKACQAPHDPCGQSKKRTQGMSRCLLFTTTCSAKHDEEHTTGRKEWNDVRGYCFDTPKHTQQHAGVPLGVRTPATISLSQNTWANRRAAIF